MEAPAQPKLPDAYADLEVSPAASSAEIKAAFHRLALLHHPDKKARGEVVDAVDFRRIQEAYDILRDSNGKRRYDRSYSSIRAQWETYRSEYAEYMQDPIVWRQRQSAERIRAQAEADRRVEEMRRQARAQAQARSWAESDSESEFGFYREDDYRHYSSGYGSHAREPELSELEEILLAELLRRRENYEAMARRSAAERAKKAAIEDINKRCVERLKKAAEAWQAESDGIRIVDPETKRAMAELWVISLQRDYDSELREANLDPSDNSVMDLGWERKKGRQTCLFCAAHVQEYSYRCPSGGAVACRGCKKKIESSSPYHPFNFYTTGAATKKGKGKKGKGGKKSQKPTDRADRGSAPEVFDSAEQEQNKEQANGGEAEHTYDAEEEAAKQAAEELARRQEAQRQKQERKAEAARRKAEHEAQAKIDREAAEKAAQKNAAKEKAEAEKAARECTTAQEAARQAAERKKETREQETREKKATRKKAAKERAALEKATQKKAAEDKQAVQREAQEQDVSKQDALKAREDAEREAKRKSNQETKMKTKREARERAAFEAKERATREAEELVAQEAQERAEREAKEREGEVLAVQEAKQRAELEAKEMAEREALEMLERVTKEIVERVTRETVERVTKETAERVTKEIVERLNREMAERLNRGMAERDADTTAEQRGQASTKTDNTDGHENEEQDTSGKHQVLEPLLTTTAPVGPPIANNAAVPEKTKKKETRAPTTCYTCNEQGHVARNCPMKHAKATEEDAPLPQAAKEPVPDIEVTRKPSPPTPAPVKVVVKLPAPRKPNVKQAANDNTAMPHGATAPSAEAAAPQKPAKPSRAPKKKAPRPAPAKDQGVDGIATPATQPSNSAPVNVTTDAPVPMQTSKPAKKMKVKVKGPLTCYVCNEAGHKAKSCPTKTSEPTFGVVR
jgi:curved DNA-binding protein CbpA